MRPILRSATFVAPVLLASAGFYGTLAAARCFGRHGVPVVVADRYRSGPARWSRYVRRREVCPEEFDGPRLLEWLVDFGVKNPGHVLYPTSDELAFLLAANRDELGRHYRMYQPPVSAVYGLLNKRRLSEVAREEGLESPRTWFVDSDSSLDVVSREARFPLLLKPVTQIQHRSHRKGETVYTPESLAEQYRDFAQEQYGPQLLAFDPTVSRPMVQEFHLEAAESIYSISGFVDESFELFATRAAVKVLQRPRKLGVGICFEGAKVDAELAEKVRRVARRLGYFGVFEVEFIRVGGRHLMIDFNPRFYGQMAFDIARGLPLPMLAYWGATGQRADIARAVAAAQAHADTGDTVFCHRLALEVVLRAQRLSGALSADEEGRWRSWLRSQGREVVDAVIDSDDWVPAALEVAQQVYGYARHPRSFFRSIVLNR